MTIQTAFQAPLGTYSTMGSDFTYCVVIPCSKTAAWGRMKFTNTSPHITVAEHVYVGIKGAGPIDFFGAPVQLTFNGSGVLTIPPGQTVHSDPFELSFSGGTPIVIAMDGKGGSGRGYCCMDGVAGCTTYYKSGSYGAVNGGNAGRTYPNSIADRVSIISHVEVADSASAFEDEEDTPPIAHYASGYSEVFAGQHFASGRQVAGEVGKYLHFILNNPSTTGRLVALTEIVITPDADCVASIRARTGALPSGATLIPSSCNLFFSPSPQSQPSKAKLYYSTETAVINSQHSMETLRGGVRNIIRLGHTPLVGVDLNQAALLALHTPGIGAVCSFMWREIVI